VHAFSTDRPAVPIRETEAKHVFDAFDTSKDESMYFGRKRRKGDGAVDDGVVGAGAVGDRVVVDDGVVVGVGAVIAVFGFCLLVAL
jgi:hypothetical protein